MSTSKHIINIMVEDEPGILARVTGLFTARGFQIESISMAPSLSEAVSKIQIVTEGTNTQVEHLIKTLNKIVSVIKVQNITREAPLTKQLLQVRINLGQKSAYKIKSLLRPFEGRVENIDEKSSLLQFVVEPHKVAEIILSLRPFGIMDYVLSGIVALVKGK